MVLGTMVCLSCVLGGDAGSAVFFFFCFETELVDGRSDFHAAMSVAFAFAAFLGLPSFFAVVCPGVATLFLGGENDFHAAMHAAIAFAALMGWPSCFAVDSPAVLAALSGGMLCYAALSGFLRRLRVLAAMLFWAALSDGYGGYACCVEYSLEFLFGAATLIAPLAAEKTRLFILLEMVQVVLCAENWVPGSFSQEVEADLFEWVEVESYELELPCTMTNNNPSPTPPSPHVRPCGRGAQKRLCEHELMFHIFEFGVPEGLRSMEAHMTTLASVGEGSESVSQGRRILELAAEEDEANSVDFLGGVLQEDNSVNESSSSSWQWPWAASGEINVWNPLLSAMADVVAGPMLDDMVSEVDMGRVALTCHFSSDVSLTFSCRRCSVWMCGSLSMRSGRLAEFPSQRKACRSFFVVAIVLEFGILRLTRLLRSGSLEGRGVRISFQIDAHHREDDARREKHQSRGDDMEVSLWRKLIVVRRLGSRLMGTKGGGLARVGLAVVRALRESTLTTLWSFYVVCRRKTRPPSGRTVVRMEVTMCLLLRVTHLKSVSVVRI